MKEARELLVEGEPLVASIPIEHGKFLCKQAKVQHVVGDLNQAEESLEQEESSLRRPIAEELNLAIDH